MLETFHRPDQILGLVMLSIAALTVAILWGITSMRSAGGVRLIAFYEKKDGVFLAKTNIGTFRRVESTLVGRRVWMKLPGFKSVRAELSRRLDEMYESTPDGAARLGEWVYVRGGSRV